MTKVTYTLNDGTVVNSMAQAKASGQKYRVTYEPIKEKSTKLTPGQMARLVRLG